MSKRSRKRIHFIKSRLAQLFFIFKGPGADEKRVLSCLKSRNWSPSEKESIEVLEQLRKDLANADQTINVQDFGAGADPDQQFSEKEMEEGVWVPVKVKDLPVSSRRMAEIMFKLMIEFKPGVSLEMGTSSGVSGAYGLSALKLNGKGKFITMEGSQETADVAIETLSKVGYKDFEIVVGKFSDTLPGFLETTDPIDFAFIDGHHDRDATLVYFDMLFDSLSDNSLVIFDDINWSKGMNEAWQQIKSDRRVTSSFDIFDRGIILVNKQHHNSKNHFNLVV